MSTINSSNNNQMNEYNTTYICKYNILSCFNEFKRGLSSINNKYYCFDDNDILNILYREDLLNVFGIESYDEELLNKSIKNVFDQIHHHDLFNECISKACSLFLSDDKELGLMILFSFEYFHLTHICVSEFISNGKINDSSIDNLLNKLKK